MVAHCSGVASQLSQIQKLCESLERQRFQLKMTYIRVFFVKLQLIKLNVKNGI